MKPLNILFADDNEAVGRYVASYLRDAGHSVTFVQTGEAAVEAFRQHRFDLVLMDIIMPGMGGLEAVRQIKALDASHWVPIIVVTALDSEEDLLNAFLAGADDYLNKPIQAIALDLRIRSMMRIAGIQETTLTIVDSVIEGVIQIDRIGRICQFNKAAGRIFGYDESEVLGQNVNMLMPSPFHENHDRYIADYVATGTPRIIGIGRQVIGRRKNGETFPMHLGVAEAVTSDGSYFVGLVRDLTHEEKLRRQIEYYATHDALTGLPNRMQCLKHLAERYALQAPQKTTADCTLLYCDLDGFKEVNDRFGHSAGDTALKEATQRIRSALFVRDFVARIGGDEFIIIVDGLIENPQASALAQRIIEAVSQPARFDAHWYQIGISIGIAHSRHHPGSAESLINAADAAMYEAKHQGKGQAVIASLD